MKNFYKSKVIRNYFFLIFTKIKKNTGPYFFEKIHDKKVKTKIKEEFILESQYHDIFSFKNNVIERKISK